MRKSTIICVDDEKIILDSLKNELKSFLTNDYTIEFAESGKEAIEIYNELLENNFDVPLIITDYIMPEMKGDELLMKMKLLNNNIYTIMLTGQATIQGVINSINNAGLYRYIAKPWETNDLILTINEALKGYNRDLELKQQRIDLEFANAKLLKLDLAKTYFLGLLSHELKTPLFGINGNAKIIAEITEDKFIKECALDILSSEARLRKFAELSLLITRIQTDKYESTFYQENIQDIIETTLFNFKDKINDKSIEIVKSVVNVNKMFNMDISLILKVFEIILDNALKNSDRNSIIEISLQNENNNVVAKIIDNGVGFSKSFLQNAFKLFVSSDDLLSHSEGTGLSMAAAKVIMEMHNFDITVQNSINGGAEVHLIF